ncbi:hypothetical protein TMatcc_000822 [Talaromyces marneffei ATCC 18224]
MRVISDELMNRRTQAPCRFGQLTPVVPSPHIKLAPGGTLVGFSPHFESAATHNPPSKGTVSSLDQVSRALALALVAASTEYSLKTTAGGLRIPDIPVA